MPNWGEQDHVSLFLERMEKPISTFSSLEIAQLITSLKADDREHDFGGSHTVTNAAQAFERAS